MSGVSGDTNLWVMHADGSGQKLLCRDREENDHDGCGSAVWSPDGKQIAFVRDYNIYVMRADGTGQRPVTRCEFFCASDPAWSPDGRRIAFSRINSDVYVVNVDGSKRHRLVEVDNPWGLTWSPGKNPLYWTDRDYRGEIYVVSADGTRLRNLTPSWADDRAGTWSPDGRRIAFERCKSRTPNCGTWTMNADGSGLRKVIGVFRSPGWSPDGRQFVFVAGSAFDAEIWVTNTDGSGRRRLTNDAFLKSSPAWQPRPRG